MESWEQFRGKITEWSHFAISDDEFYCYLISSEFGPADQRVATIFIGQHDRGEWSHAIYHRMR